MKLLLGATLPWGWLYNITHPEGITMEDNITDSLASRIQSSSPVGAGLFSVAKKLGSLCPCIDYWGSATTLPLKVSYYEKHVFFGLYKYKLVLPEPANTQIEESKQVLHGLWSPSTGKTGLLQAAQIQLVSKAVHFVPLSKLPSTWRLLTF